MQVVYYTLGESLSPQIVAAIHLRLLPMEHYPYPLEWQRVPYAKGFVKQDWGRILLVGRYNEWEVYMLPIAKKTEKMVLKTLQATLELTQLTNKVILKECGFVASPPRVTQLLNRWFQEYYQPLVHIVKEVEEGLRH